MNRLRRLQEAFALVSQLQLYRSVNSSPFPDPWRLAMQVELFCPHCHCRFAASPDAPAAEVLDRMTEEGPWYALGDGQTFEDMIFHALTERGAILCPDCAEPVSVSEESLGQLTMEVLASW